MPVPQVVQECMLSSSLRDKGAHTIAAGKTLGLTRLLPEVSASLESQWNKTF